MNNVPLWPLLIIAAMFVGIRAAAGYGIYEYRNAEYVTGKHTVTVCFQGARIDEVCTRTCVETFVR